MINELLKFFTIKMFRSNTVEYEEIGQSNYQTFQSTNSEDENYTIYGYRVTTKNKIFMVLLNIFCLGIPFIVSCWYPKLKTLVYEKCSLQSATKVLICDNYQINALLDVQSEQTNFESFQFKQIRYFYYRYSKFVWFPDKNCFGPISFCIPPKTISNLLQNTDGLSNSEAEQLLNIYGLNKIEVEVKSYSRLFIEEVFNPFYIFQVFSILLWCIDDYLIYAGCVLFLSLLSIITSLIQTRRQSEALHDLVETTNCEDVEVMRRNASRQRCIHKLNPSELVPGDILVLPRTSFIMPCDALLLSGHCIVNESSLTGESVPVTKTPPHSSDDTYISSNYKRHTLFAGTSVIQSRYYGGEHVLASVVKTGFDTTKGSLVKSILYPTPVGLTFYKDSLKFVVFLFIIAATGMVYCLYLYTERKAEISYMIIRALDIFTIVVPPALPAAMTVGTVYSQKRLKDLGIFCISPPRINVCGKIKLACFDKTGTLTHDGLDLFGVVPNVDANFQEVLKIVSRLKNSSMLLQGMASCHSLTRINGELTGDPLDLSMFESTEWELEEPGEVEDTRYEVAVPTIVKSNGDEGYEIGILKQFPFSSNQQCMSVICREINSKHMVVFTKGAPERLQGMCNSETLPESFSTYLSYFTMQGFRCIAVAYKTMPPKFTWKHAQKIGREEIECNLQFLGFIIMQNTLKSETTPVIKALHNANIRTVMITGDNVMTAISVARDCQMVKVSESVILIKAVNDENSDGIPTIIAEFIGEDSNFQNLNDTDKNHFAMDGKTWQKLKQYYPDFLPQLLLRSTIFARFQPDQKAQLVTYLQSLDYVVSMVGDGANDCGALKAAHVGVSLSQAEASVAAPFTSSVDNISCILSLILEGRCALVTSFAVFKYMALYSLIQFITILILYKHHSILGDMQFLFIDLIITTSLAVTIGRQGPSKKLASTRPMGSLVSATNLIPLTLQIVVCVAIQLGSYYYLKIQPWFTPLQAHRDETITCWENTVLFTVSCFQYVILACVFSKGLPHRQGLYMNFWLLFSAVLLTAFTVLLIVYPVKELAKFFEIMAFNDEHTHIIFRCSLLLFPAMHLFLAIFIEVFIAESRWLKKLVHVIARKKRPKNKFKAMLQETNYMNCLRDGHVISM